MRFRFVAILTFLGAGATDAHAQATLHLEVEAKIPLGDVRGRIDHLALDIDGQRLFVAELGNNTVGVIDLKQRKVAQRLEGLDEPQGTAWSPQRSMLYVASGGDGTLRSFTGRGLAKGLVVKLGDDADNVRVDAAGQRVYVGFGNGAIAVVDSATLKRQADLRLTGHPESFQLEQNGTRIFVNVPDRPEITALDRSGAAPVQHWAAREARANFPLALDEAAGRVYSVFRSPAALEVLSTKDGTSLVRVPVCADADDLFLDDARHLAYIVCGEGRVD